MLQHASFTAERLLSADRERVFKAFADKQAKEVWFKGPSQEPSDSHTMDFRVGGHETNVGHFQGVEHRFEATYYDIVPDERIIYVYEMYLDGKHISVSLASLEFEAVGDKTQLTLVEDGIFLDNLDTVQSREKGTNDLLDAVEHSLANK